MIQQIRAIIINPSQFLDQKFPAKPETSQPELITKPITVTSPFLNYNPKDETTPGNKSPGKEFPTPSNADPHNYVCTGSTAQLRAELLNKTKESQNWWRI